MSAQQQVAAYGPTLKLICFVVAIVLFVLAAFTGTWNKADMVALGLAFFAAGHVVP